MRLILYCFLLLLLSKPGFLSGQQSSFDSFITVLTKRYEVDVALAPELIPALDSIKNYGTEISSVEEFLHQMLSNKNISYQIIDGNKVLLRQDLSEGNKDGHVRIEGIIKEKAAAVRRPGRF